MPVPKAPRAPWIETLTRHVDERGTLVEVTSAGGRGLNWCRAFTISVTGPSARGGHAHRECTQGLAAITGSVSVRVFDGLIESMFRLSRPSDVLVVPPLNWLDLEFKEPTTLLVLADRPYEVEDYVKSREELTKTREN